MMLPSCRGTVLVVDSKGVSWSRMWCVFELFHSLTGSAAEGRRYMFDVYTAHKHTYKKVVSPSPRAPVPLTHC